MGDAANRTREKAIEIISAILLSQVTKFLLAVLDVDEATNLTIAKLKEAGITEINNMKEIREANSP